MSDGDKLAAIITPEQFRLLAVWFDEDDRFKMMLYAEDPHHLPSTWQSRGGGVQADIRRFADALQAIQSRPVEDEDNHRWDGKP